MFKSYYSPFKSMIDLLMILVSISIPFSIDFYFKSIHSAVIYPAEPLIGLLAILFILQIVFPKLRFLVPTKQFLKHPITILVFIYILAISFSVLFSTMFLVSAKALLIKGTYILVFYFLVHTLLNNNERLIMTWIKLYGISFSFIVLYSLFQHALFKFSKFGSGYVCRPFYSDHTIYGAALVFLLPAFFSFSFFHSKFDQNSKTKWFYLIILFIFLLGLYFSFCRAAWVSLCAILLLLFLVGIGFRYKGIIFILLTLLLFFYADKSRWIESFKKNKTDSNINGAGLYEQLFSLTNITNDLSNKERLNRWSCAIRMFKDKPITGFGLGTFQFQYLPYQLKEEMTYISVHDPYNIMLGNGGTAHSEYFLALAESGIIALFAFIALGVFSLKSGLDVYSIKKLDGMWIISFFLLFSLVSYFIHGFFNNYLDNCKIAFLFWASLSAIVTMHCKAQKNLV